VAGGIGIAAIGGLVIDEKANSMTKIVVTKQSGLTDIRQLAGKTVATPTIGAVSNIAFLYWLKKSGVDLKTVKIVEVPYPNMGDQLKGGRVDAVQSIQPFLARHMAEGDVALGSHLLVVQDPALFVFWSADATWAKANGKTLAKWDQAMEEAHKLIKSDDKAARAILATYTKLPPAIAEKVPLPTYRFSIDAKDLKVWDGVLRELDQLSTPVDFGKIVHTAR
jgi:NitT/TauT family transport system substrate-binding protein